MTERLTPSDERDVAALVGQAVADGAALELAGAASKRAFGRPVAAARLLDLSRLSGVMLYEPEELVLTARAATPISEIVALLAQRGQELAFEPPHWGDLLGAKHEGTLGGVIACNLAGPRRVKSGAARDHVLGCRAVSGRGEAFKAGGRVVKNVTGYDVCKLMAGSYGTLAALTEATVRVLPKAEKTRTLLLFGLDDAAAIAVMAQAAGSPHDVSGLAHLPAGIARRSKVSYVAGAGQAVTGLRVEGPAPSVEYRLGALKRMFSGRGAIEELHSANSHALWREVGDVAYFASRADGVVWRLNAPPSQGAAVAAAIGRQLNAQHYFDWAGGLIWLALPERDDADHAAVRAALPRDGAATLVKASAAIRARAPVFQPQDAALAALTRRVKQGFDPAGILNPGRMYDGV
jgi:glycolate oxidase FAD binding subunit